MTAPRLLRALRGEPVDRRPLWIMRQAGRYLPEYRELRRSRSFEEICADPETAAEVTLMPLERFPLDGAIVFADLVTPLESCGVRVRFAPGPVIEKPVRDAAGLDRLRRPEAGAAGPGVAETIRRVRSRLSREIPVIGFAGAPLSLAAYLVQGRGERGFPALTRLIETDEPLAERLLEFLTDLTSAYLGEQLRAGAEVVQLFDTWGGLLDRPTWQRVVRPHLVRLLTEVGGERAPRIVFVRNAPHLVEDYAALPCEALSVDWLQDLPELRRSIGAAKALQGNLDPSVLLEGPMATARAAEALLARMPARGHVVNLGHGILKETPLESVSALVDCVHAEDATNAASQ